MYCSITIDPITGVPLRFDFLSKRNEISLAVGMIETFENNSITLYDRLYFSVKLVLAHNLSENFYICRCQKGGTHKAIIDFYKSDLLEKNVVIAGMEVRLVKLKNNRSGEYNIFGTNLPKREFSKEEIEKIYFRRWESEISNRDLSCSLKIEQFHSRNLNGIFQDIFASLWLMAYTKIEIFKEMPELEIDFLEKEYKKANVKEVLNFIIINLAELILSPSLLKKELLAFIIKKSISTRKRMARSYPRQVKSSRGRKYINASTVPKRMKVSLN